MGREIPTVLSQLSGEGGRLAAAPKPAAEAPGVTKAPAKEK